MQWTTLKLYIIKWYFWTKSKPFILFFSYMMDFFDSFKSICEPMYIDFFWCHISCTNYASMTEWVENVSFFFFSMVDFMYAWSYYYFLIFAWNHK